MSWLTQFDTSLATIEVGILVSLGDGLTSYAFACCVDSYRMLTIEADIWSLMGVATICLGTPTVLPKYVLSYVDTGMT